MNPNKQELQVVPHRDQIVEQALSLPPEVGVLIAKALQQSRSGGAVASPNVAQPPGAEEIEGRLAAIDRGEINAVDGRRLDHLGRPLAERLAKKLDS